MGSVTGFRRENGKSDFAALVGIMRLLRSPGGCPWDREQTHESIRRNLIEEAYEVAEAIDNGESAPLCEELGDLLLQIVFHARMEEELGAFSIEDVIDGICRKLILRHPHIFADTAVTGSGEVLKNWDEIKKREKGQQTDAQALSSVSRSLPALMRSVKVQQRVARAGFALPDSLQKVDEELSELKAAALSGDKLSIKEELGDLLFTISEAARILDIEPEEALSASTDKFIRRFTRLEHMVTELGGDIKDTGADKLDKLWETVKSEEASEL